MVRSMVRLKWTRPNLGGRKKNMSKEKRREAFGRGPAGKTMVMGAKDRETNRVAAQVIERKDRETMQGFVADHASPGATVYTDTAGGYSGMTGFDHEKVNHNIAEGCGSGVANVSY